MGLNANAQTPKILMFIEASSVNGAAKSLLNFWDTITSMNRSKRPVTVSIATFHRGELKGSDTPNEFVEAVRKRAIAAHVIAERYRFDSRLLTSIQEVVRQTSPDIVQTNNVKSHFLIKAAGIEKQSHWIAFHHGYTTTDLKMRFYNQLDRWSLRSAERVVTVCGAFERQLTGYGVPRKRIRIVHNSCGGMPRLPETELRDVKKRLGIEPDARVLLTIGRLSREKGHADLLRAASWVRQMRPSLKYKFVVVGFGPEQARLEEQRDRLGLRPDLVLACSEAEVAPFYGIADMFILPSHTEGSPHVIFEAMAADVPIVATRVGGIPELLQDGETAILVPPRNPKRLACAIVRLLDSPEVERRYADKAHETLRNRFSPEVYARGLLGIYGEVLQPRVD
jgi:glycosyltransferase involved in cell wall biosynthesis